MHKLQRYKISQTLFLSTKLLFLYRECISDKVILTIYYKSTGKAYNFATRLLYICKTNNPTEAIVCICQ